MPDWIEIIVRTMAAMVILFALTKVLGKRQISQLSLFEYITGITIGNIAAYISLELDNLWYLGIVSLIVWVGVSVGMEFATVKSKKMRDIVDGKGTVLIKNGQLIKKNLLKERLTMDEMLEQLRKKDVYRVADVEFAVMEQSGEVNVLLKKEYQPITPELLGWKIAPGREAKTVVIDGNILEDVLHEAGYDRNWLLHELKKNKLKEEDVFFAQIDSNGELQLQTGIEGLQTSGNQTKPGDRVSMLLEQFEAELVRLERLSRNESDRRIYQTARDRFQAGYNAWLENRIPHK
ncbi:uncharacterized membrane protein YcaP (DUF421 family) [Paenibacillus castaneae]|uniref:DUF421 domain-containing protein n=1 Tax=Paenibacillus castaneae TaxID=474957 RepID=UPI000C9991AB|nr:DUF421 domain-containing protein [Paenibacillus castaneae]NIK79578.1 uncharacterized membrane protein YcaP (DUF421 family) [Paenibacillus castaneae]